MIEINNVRWEMWEGNVIEINNERWGYDEVGFNASQFLRSSQGTWGFQWHSSADRVLAGFVTAQVVKKLRDWVGAQSSVDIFRDVEGVLYNYHYCYYCCIIIIMM